MHHFHYLQSFQRIAVIISETIADLAALTGLEYVSMYMLARIQSDGFRHD
jgi:hypothetical protein